jgi:hypothetical protein
VDALSASHRTLQRRNGFSRSASTAGCPECRAHDGKGCRARQFSRETGVRSAREASRGRIRGSCRRWPILRTTGCNSHPFCEGDAIGACWIDKRGRQRNTAESRGGRRDALSEEKSSTAPDFKEVEVRGGRVEVSWERCAFRTMGVGGFLTLRRPRLSQHSDFAAEARLVEHLTTGRIARTPPPEVQLR